MPFFVILVFLTALALGNSIFISSVMDSSSFQAIMRPMKGLFVFLGLYFAISRLSARYFEKNGARQTYEMLLGVTYVAVLIHGAIIIFQSMSPSLLDLTYRVIGGGEILDSNKAFRMPGLAGAGGAQLSAVQGLGFLIGVHLALIQRRHVLFALGNLLLIASFVLTGRTGFVLVGIALPYWAVFIVIDMKNKIRRRNPLHLIAGALLLLASLLLIVWLTPQITSAYDQEAWLKRAVDRTFATYLNYVNTGEFYDSTLDTLGDMFVLPNSVLQWTFGDARLYNNVLNVYISDIGYVRLWWGYGIIGLVGYIVFYLWMGYLVLRPRVRQVMGVKNVIFGLVVLASVFILNYKETFFLTRISYQISIVCVMGLYWLTRRAAVISRPSSIAAISLRS